MIAASYCSEIPRDADAKWRRLFGPLHSECIVSLAQLYRENAVQNLSASKVIQLLYRKNIAKRYLLPLKHSASLESQGLTIFGNAG